MTGLGDAVTELGVGGSRLVGTTARPRPAAALEQAVSRAAPVPASAIRIPRRAVLMDSPLFAHGTSLERPRAPGSLSYRGLGFQTPYRACPEVPRTVSDVRVSSAGSRQARGRSAACLRRAPASRAWPRRRTRFVWPVRRRRRDGSDESPTAWLARGSPSGDQVDQDGDREQTAEEGEPTPPTVPQPREDVLRHYAIGRIRAP